ncbi:toll/interleukin-1 receptor domain-containing protein [Dactylosporangium salmoneum]
MTVLRPQVFMSYSRRDEEYVRGLRGDLLSAGVECWIDTANIQAGDRLNPAIEEAISRSSLMFAYVTKSYLRSRWCMKELRHALASPQVTVAPYADSPETLTEVPDDLIDEIAFGVLTPEVRTRALVELAGRAWASLQTVRRVVPAANHILAGPAIFDSAGYSRSDLMRRARKELILAGPNLRSWLSDRECKRDLVALVKQRRVRVTLILTTYECLRPIAAEGAVHLRESAKDIRSMLAELDGEERDLMSAHFHVGAATLSAVIIDPATPEGILFFSPRWAIQFLPQDRMTCVIDKSVNSADLFKAVYNGVLLMTQGDAKSVEEMLT